MRTARSERNGGDMQWTFRIAWNEDNRGYEYADTMYEEYAAEDVEHAIEQWAEMRNSVAERCEEVADRTMITTISKREEASCPS